MPNTNNATSRDKKRSGKSGNGSTGEEKNRVVLNLTPEMAAAVDDVIANTTIPSRTEVFRKAFSLLRIHLKAQRDGKHVFVEDPANPDQRYIVSLDHIV